MLLFIFLFIVYTVNLPVVRPRCCWVIYYFDTPTLGRRHQLFGRVTYNTYLVFFIPFKLLILLLNDFFLFLPFFIMQDNDCSFTKHKKYIFCTP